MYAMMAKGAIWCRIHCAFNWQGIWGGEGKECFDLKSKIYYFCQPSDFGDYFLNNEKNNRETAIKIIQEKNIKNGCILRKTSIIDTRIVKNYVITTYDKLHIPIRHRFGFGYYLITNAKRHATLKETSTASWNRRTA